MFISYLIFACRVQGRVLSVYILVSGSLFELPETFTLGIKLELRKIQSEKLRMIVIVVIIQSC